jgi:hypothetical protein
MGIDPMNNISIVIRILFAVTIFQQYNHKQGIQDEKDEKLVKVLPQWSRHFSIVRNLTLRTG